MPNRVIDPQELRQMIQSGKTYAEIAAHYNVTVSGVQQAAERIGMQKKTLSHREFIPWTVAKAHQHSGPVTSLRNLSKVWQGQDVPLAKLNTALRWATRLREEHLDIDYDRERGFFEKPADESNWHIRRVLMKVRETLAGQKP